MKKYWYAVMRDNSDDDWGTGSYDFEEAKKMMDKEYPEEEYPERYIAVIDDSVENPVCVDEIR